MPSEINQDARNVPDDEQIVFGSDGDYALVYDSTNDRFEIVDTGAGNDAIRVDSTQDTSFVGNNLTEVGGTTDASSGAIRIANGNDIRFRNSANDSDIVGLRTATDTLQLGGGQSTAVEILNTDLDLGGNLLDNTIGGVYQQRPADPGTGDLDSGEVMVYASDGSADATGDAGDLIYARNNSGTIETTTIVDASNAT